MNLSIVIVSWNVREKLRECLRSIYEYAGAIADEVFVVDNASKDGSAQMVKKEFQAVQVIANDFNAGFSKANNQAIGLAQGRYVLLLNPDMRLFPDTLTGVVKFMDDPRNARVGVAGCWLVDEQGNTVPQVRHFPQFVDQLAIMLKMPHFFPRVLDYYLMKDFDYSKEARVDSIRGSFFMIRRELLDKIGLLDEGFFIWFEEVDFCKRAIEAGYAVAYTPTVKCIDYVGQSFKQVRLYTKQKMMTRSLLHYFKKHHPWWQYRILWLGRPFMLGAVWIGDKLNVQAKRVT